MITGKGIHNVSALTNVRGHSLTVFTRNLFENKECCDWLNMLIRISWGKNIE